MYIRTPKYMLIKVMLNNLPNETDSVLLANPKLIKDEQHNAFANLLSFDESLLYSSGHFSSRNELISCIVAMLHGVEVLTYLPIMYLYKDDFKVSPAFLTFILGLIRLPLNIKLLFAFMSDAVPLFGSRRRIYLAIGSFICFTSMFTLGLLDEDYSIVLTTSLLALCSLGSALCSVIGEALVIECAYKQSTDQVTKTISTFYTFRKLTFAAMSYLSSVLIMMIKKRQIFMIAASLPFCVFFTSFFIQEKPFGCYLSIKEQYQRLINFASKPEIKNPSTFLFISMIIPSAGTAMFYFMTERLHFQPELFGRFAAFQAIASLFGIYCYLMFFRTMSIRRLFVWTTYLVATFCTFSIMLVKRWNLILGIPDKAFAITDTSLIQFIGEMNSFPIYVMATRLCPRGIESSMYSFLWTVQFLGMDISTYISSVLTHLFKIEKHNFTGLVPMIVLCAFAQLIPNLFVDMLPDQLPTVQMEDEVGACMDDVPPDQPSNKMPVGFGKVAGIVAAGAAVPYLCLFDVDGGERAVMFNRFAGGVSKKTFGEGSHFYIPWFQVPYLYDIRAKPKVINTTTGTQDLQMVSISLRLLYRPYTEHLPRLHQKLGPDFDERVLPSIGNEVLKAVVAKYNAESLLTQRDKVSHDIREAITARAMQFDIKLDDVAITHLSYGKDFSKAIEEKQVAQQESERVKFIVAKSEQERIAAVVRAEGEAEAAHLISKAVQNYGSGMLEVRKLEAAKEIAETLSSSKNVVYVPNNLNMMINPTNL